MFAVCQFKSLSEALIFFLVVAIVVGIPAYYYYKKSLLTRKVYKCRECGEVFKTEHMESNTCKVCGAEVDEI